MALTKQNSTPTNANLRVQWPDLPELEVMRDAPEDQQRLEEWYFQLRQSLDRTLQAIVEAKEANNATA